MDVRRYIHWPWRLRDTPPPVRPPVMPGDEQRYFDDVEQWSRWAEWPVINRQSHR